MAVVTLPARLRELAQGRSELRLEGATLGTVLHELQRAYPGIKGWVLDEAGEVRPHVNVFVNGERVPLDTTMTPDDRIHILPAISGGDAGAELLVGTRKGLIVLRGERGGAMDVAGRRFPGEVVEFAMRDARTGRYLAGVTHGQWGPRIYYTTDPLGEWEQADGPAFPSDAGATVSRVWVIKTGEEEDVLWAGVAPAALFRSEDGGRSWALNPWLWDVPGRDQWQGGAGGLCLHSICTWPGEPARIAVATSAAGVWLTDDGGYTWGRGVRGLVPRYLPEDVAPETADLCVHNMHRAPRQPETLYLQFHGGVYRSDDSGDTWHDIAAGLPSDFGFPLVVDPDDPDRAFVLPLASDEDRVTPEGKLRVYETRDRGATWHALTEGLPQESAYFTVLRQAFCHDHASPLGLYFGTEQGEVYASADGGASWALAAAHLPPVTSVRASFDSAPG